MFQHIPDLQKHKLPTFILKLFLLSSKLTFCSNKTLGPKCYFGHITQRLATESVLDHTITLTSFKKQTSCSNNWHYVCNNAC